MSATAELTAPRRCVPEGGNVAARERARDALLEALVDRGALSEEHAAEALAIHGQEGGWLGQVLAAYGFCHRLELYQAWADVLGLPFANLVLEPPQVELFRDGDVESMLRDQWVPWRLRQQHRERVLMVASADPARVPSERLAADAGAARVEVAIATDWDILQAVSTNAGDVVARLATEAVERTRPELSARHGMSRGQKLFAAGIAIGMAALASWDPFVGLATLLWLLNIVFIASIAMKGLLFGFGAGAVRKQEEARLRHAAKYGRPPGRRRIPDGELPRYTILIPAYREANVVPRVLENIRRLDYPLAKLQVLLLLESDDVETITAAKATRTPDFLRIVVVPPGEPRTKPRACNVGLGLARGEFLVIYDAEDRPEPGQLREVVALFRDSEDELCCIQARLNYYNAAQNFITRMFTLEYCLWFDYLLPGLERLRMPIPLGGTSNHFRVSALRALGGWDPWNVTEDADLGIRATALGYRVATADSTTWEEACPEWWPWIRQRTRWIKGFMLTTVVHTRSLRRLYGGTGWRGVATLFLFIAGTPAAFLLYPIVVIAGLWGLFALPLPNFRLPGALPELSTVSLVLGTSLMVVLTAASARRRRQWSLLGYAVLNPVYWLLHSTAAWRALGQLVRKPSHWEKTPHGLAQADHATPDQSPTIEDERRADELTLLAPAAPQPPTVVDARPVEWSIDAQRVNEESIHPTQTVPPRTRGAPMSIGARAPGHPVLRRQLRGYAPEAVERLLARAVAAAEQVADERDAARERYTRTLAALGKVTDERDEARERLAHAQQEIDRLERELEQRRGAERRGREALLTRLIGPRTESGRRNGHAAPLPG